MPKMNDVPDSAVTTGPALWPDVETLFGIRGDPSRCWCRFFTLTSSEYNNTSPEERKSQLRARFDSPKPEPGVMAYLEGKPVGWCAVEPRSCYPRIERSQLMRDAAPRLAELPVPGDIWSVTCFVVASGHRRKGIAAALLQAAVEHAFTHGAAMVEGYPIDPAARPKAGAADLYHGPLSLFLTAGFRLVDTTTPGRAVVRLDKVSG
ncbi:GNAT family N-acetyltransferase [Arthrobacter sp. R1-13]